MSTSSSRAFFEELYREFSSPLSDIDCGLKCGPYNDYGVPVCCDIKLTIPAAFEDEWEYLQESADLWKPWSSSAELVSLEDELQDGQVLLQCLGYQKCQRPFRTLTCRAFPFYPYLDSRGELIGLGYYRDYRDDCWVISNLEIVTKEFRREFQEAYQQVFLRYPESKSDFLDYAESVRKDAKEGQWITLLDFDTGVFLINPETEESRQVEYQELEAYGIFAVGKELHFPDEDQE